MNKVIGVIGSIGAGKSSLIDQIRWKDVGVFEENLKAYRKFGRYDPLELLYTDPQQNVALAQHHFIKCINNQLRESNTICKLWITDRSLFCPIIFVENLYKQGMISEFSKDYLVNETREFAQQTLDQMNLKYAGIVYLDTPPETCMERIQKRGRDMEKHIKLEYLTGIQSEYEESVKWWTRHLGKDRVCRISGLQTKEEIVHRFEEFVTKFL